MEVHDERELEAALEVEADVLGINNRNLSDFSVDIERTFELLADIPAGKTVVSESGFRTRDQLDELERVGVDAVLIGETLMRAPDIEAAARELTGFGELLVKVKICGITRLEDAELASALGAWGSASSSGRSPSATSTRRVAAGIARAVRRKVELVGVFVNQPLDEIAGLADVLGLTHVQLHGDEGPSFCKRGRPAHGREGDQGGADRRTPPTCATSTASTPTSTCSTRPRRAPTAAPGTPGTGRCSRSAAARSRSCSPAG